jgi:hypothetical protein
MENGEGLVVVTVSDDGFRCGRQTDESRRLLRGRDGCWAAASHGGPDQNSGTRARRHAGRVMSSNLLTTMAAGLGCCPSRRARFQPVVLRPSATRTIASGGGRGGVFSSLRVGKKVSRCFSQPLQGFPTTTWPVIQAWPAVQGGSPVSPCPAD